MNQDNNTQVITETTPLFTTRDTCVGLAACMGIGLLTSITLSIIILILAATSSVQANDNNTENDSKSTIISSMYSPEDVITQSCDTHVGQLRNITVGDELSFLNEANHRQFFRVTGIQAVDSKPEVMPVVDDASMLTLVTCYPGNMTAANKAETYLIMIQELTQNNLSVKPVTHI